MNAPYRYARRPRTGESLMVSPDEVWPITAVHDNGRRIETVDRIGRAWTLTRAERGCWLVTPTPPAPA